MSARFLFGPALGQAEVDELQRGLADLGEGGPEEENRAESSPFL